MGLLLFQFPYIALFGTEVQYEYVLIVAIATLVSYFIVSSFVKWLISLQSERLISYLFSSFIIMLALFSIPAFFDVQPGKVMPLFILTLQILTLYGMVLVLFNSLRHLYYYFKK